MGSVKDLKTLKMAQENELGVGQFIFSDRYSVFDWGEMPDHMSNKGAALCLMGAYCFERAEEMGIKTHYRGLVSKDGTTVRINDLEEPTNIMEVNLVRVIYPKFESGYYDYSVFESDLTNFLIPLEVIYRNGLPEGSSVFKRLERGDITYEVLGLDHSPQPGERLEIPLFDVSTKLEERDRYITWKEAQDIAKLKDLELNEIKKVISDVNNLITETAKKANLTNEDGKIELGYGPNRELMLVDVIGTLDECRFTFNEIHVSKEIARQFYKTTDWYKDVENAKEIAKVQRIRDWKKLCSSKPRNLDPELKGIISQMYMSTANAFLDTNIFDSPKLEEVVNSYKKWLESKY
ncbi:phosphoribosylaminoimidazolesuccinocarboxamide synthase [Candidatus Borrarchaeum sp.]|uniref:phosphoribosylaminoimidazolesuccinocarboxamide synthase n=1 Tax=Candidatus Borrarchaeum sp. TaxID=2846742 RepID=UPI00257CF024|nr:phosphoribosylaminoimidazolesuccinocarboxamide synthase [Candidatus Borrarchaeum sp.]